jgi:hypothetical protein
MLQHFSYICDTITIIWSVLIKGSLEQNCLFSLLKLCLKIFYTINKCQNYTTTKIIKLT